MFRNGPTAFQRSDPTDIREGTHPISGGPLRFLSEATNYAILANWRRIQLMDKERTSVRMQAQIKIMSEQGHSIRSIARVLKLSRRTVRRYLEPAPQWPSENGGWEEKIDWDYVRQEVYGKGTTDKQIGQEVAPEIAYVKFWRVFREKAGLKASPEQVTIRLHHKAEKTQKGL